MNVAEKTRQGYAHRTCDQCSRFVEEDERLNTPPAIDHRDPKWVAFGWYGQDGVPVNHYCDQCYLALRLEGQL